MFLIGIIFGFFLPGYFLAKLLRAKEELATSFVFSWVILFNVIFYLGIIRITFNFFVIITTQIVISLLLYFLCKKHSRDVFCINTCVIADKKKFLLILPYFVFLCLFILRTILQPYDYAPGDQMFRWDYLAFKIFKDKNFIFYPPINEEDFHHYAYPDGLPPMVSFMYYWVYESFGQYLPVLSCIFIISQFIVISILCCMIVQDLFSEKLSFFVLLILSCSPLYFFSLRIGQESGLLSISLIGTIYYACYTRMSQENSYNKFIISGIFASLGALSREYGYAITIIAGLSMFLRGNKMKEMLTFIFFSILFSLPWYIRNLIVAGNPFYSNDLFGLFNVNEVHVRIFEIYKKNLSFVNKPEILLETILTLLAISFIPTIFGVAGLLINPRKYIPILISLGIFSLLWGYSMSVTPGGVLHSLRVISPLIPLFSICACELYIKGQKLSKIIVFVVTYIFSILSICQSTTIPINVFAVPRKFLYEFAFGQYIFFPKEDLLAYQTIIGKNSKVLTDDAIFHSRLWVHDEIKFRAVSIWSPEVNFLFDESIPLESIKGKLKEKGIKYVFMSNKSLNYLYFKKFPFFTNLESEHFRHIKGNLYEIVFSR